jgi:putative Ca2+/H+ antiporter (TMEM165/GDT1 family)
LFGEWLVRRIPQRTVRVVAALIFLVMGVAVLAT